jgi:hypothetical protein
MFRQLINFYGSFRTRATLSLCVQACAQDKKFPPAFVHTGSGFLLHSMASVARAEILRQAKNSLAPPRTVLEFESTAWKVATFALLEAVPKLVLPPSPREGLVIPYACFLSECFSSTYVDGEERDICISADGEVFIMSFAGMETNSKSLGNYKA